MAHTSLRPSASNLPKCLSWLPQLASLPLLLGLHTAFAQAKPLPPVASTEAAPGLKVTPDKSYLIPAAEIIGFDFLLSNANRQFSGSSDYDVSLRSIRRNLRGHWVIDNDPFRVNQFAHPYQGSIYHGAARSAGLGYWEASAYTFVGSAWWEITGEKTPPSRNDQVASGIAGSFLGEPLFRMAHLVLHGKGPISTYWREIGAAAISPALGFNRLMYGSRFDGAFDDHDPIYYSRLRVGIDHVTRDDAGSAKSPRQNVGEIDYALDYGVPGQPGYTYDRPFDYFSFAAVLSSANGVENLGTRGLLFGAPYSAGADVRGLLGVYGSYDYLAPQLFHLSTTAVSLGTTAQWWLTDRFALQGTGLAGLGYSAASTARGVAVDTDYHYGVAPRLSLALRLIGGDRASLDMSGQKYFLGRIANRSAGRDDISRIDTAFTWRLAGHHAIGVKYVWSHRSANYPTAGNRQQTLGTFGIYYTLLGADNFGAVDWRDGTVH
ncbi:hypothetical protein BH11PSE8_BH11PSE8_29590 [soil metagenome]